MRVTHELEICCQCPVDERPDVYQATIVCSRVIPCEDIVAAADEAAGLTMYQEELAEKLHRQLKAQVTLRGYHGRVRTTVVVG